MVKINEAVVTGLVFAQRILSRVRERAAHAEQGQGTVEYALILAFVAVVAILAFKFLQPAILDAFNRVANTLNTSSTPVPLPVATPTP